MSQALGGAEAGLRTAARTPLLRVVLLGLGISVVPLDTAVNIAFPDITGSLGLPIPMIQWVVICYVLSNAGPLLAFGRVGDMWGHARVFRAGLVWSIAAFLLCSMASSFGWLLFCRALQGIGAALIISCAPALVTALYPEERRSRALGTFTLIFAMSSALGPLIGGLLVARWGWPAVFWFRAPISLACLLFLRGLPVRIGDKKEQRFDILGAVLLATGLASLLLGVNGLPRLGSGDYLSLGLLPAAVICFVAFVWWEARTPQPIVRVQLFRNIAFAGVNFASCMMYLVTFSVMLFVPYFFPRYTTLPLPVAGIVLAAGFIAMALTSPLAGRLIAHVPAERVAPLGALSIGIGLWLVSTWSQDTAPAVMILTLALHGFGLALFQVSYLELVIAASPPEHRGVAGSLSMLTRTIGVVSGAAMLTLGFQTIQAAAAGSPDAFLTAFRAMFGIAGTVAILAGVVVAWSAWGKTGKTGK